MIDDEELESHDLLYRHARTFAVGHGCSATGKLGSSDARARLVRSEFVPEAPVNLADSNPAITSAALSMRFCTEAEEGELLHALEELRGDYAAWIDAIEQEGSSAGSRYLGAVTRHVEDCRIANDRLRQGIDTLRRDPDSMHAFRRPTRR